MSGTVLFTTNRAVVCCSASPNDIHCRAWCDMAVVSLMQEKYERDGGIKMLYYLQVKSLDPPDILSITLSARVEVSRRNITSQNGSLKMGRTVLNIPFSASHGFQTIVIKIEREDNTLLFHAIEKALVDLKH